MKLEVTKAYKKRRAIEQKKQREIDLSPARQQQPLVRSIRYDNVRSAVAEEGLLMLLKEPELIPTVRLPGEHCPCRSSGACWSCCASALRTGSP